MKQEMLCNLIIVTTCRLLQSTEKSAWEENLVYPEVNLESSWTFTMGLFWGNK